MRTELNELIKSEQLCVLATVGSGLPHCSLMSYAVPEDGDRIYLASSRNTRKYRNLLANPGVSLLIDSRQTGAAAGINAVRALVIRGSVLMPLVEAESKEAEKLLIQRHPGLADFFRAADTEIMAVSIDEVQLLAGQQEI
jgi:nitroimidazol reductase NimA-like FMN-containing flavoprotein (pyridoxamine 5'-phosphate oxidase superfamily)